MSKVLDSFGIDSRQYFLLLDLFRKLDDRQEFALNSTKVARYTLVVSLTLIMAVISYLDVLSDSVSLSSFIDADIMITALLLSLILMTETINAFFNPVEAAVFADIVMSGNSKMLLNAPWCWAHRIISVGRIS